MKQAAIAIGIALAVLVLALPLLPTGADEEDSAPAPAQAADAGPGIPSEYEAPPLWNAENIVGTAWEAGLAEIPMVDDEDSELVLQYHFVGPGQLRLTFDDPGLKDDDGSATLMRGFLPDTTGTFTVDGAQILVEARMVTGDSTDVIEIRGDRLYYHGAEMRPLHDDGRGQAPGAGY